MVALGPPEQVTDASAAVGVGSGDEAGDDSIAGVVGASEGDGCAWTVGVGWWVAAGEVWATGRALAPQAIAVTAAISKAAPRRQVISLTETGTVAIRYGRVLVAGWPRSTDQPIMSRHLSNAGN